MFRKYILGSKESGARKIESPSNLFRDIDSQEELKINNTLGTLNTSQIEIQETKTISSVMPGKLI